MVVTKERRQKFLNAKGYLEDFEQMDLTIALSKEELAKPEELSMSAESSFRWTIASNGLQLLLLQYTAGRPIDEVRAMLPAIIEDFDTFIANEITPRSENPPRNEADTLEITQLDAYVYVFWLLALSKLLNHDESIPKIMGWVDKTFKFNRGRDILFENVIQALTGKHVHSEPMLLHPVPYRPLGRATAVPPEGRAAYLKEFVESWYKGMKPTYWHGSHTGGIYFGYCCLEAALVTVLFDIDDSSYRDNLVYPKDLVDWWRAHRPTTSAQANKTIINAVPGEPCPHSGEWFSPFLKKTVKLVAGEPMPGPEYDPSGNQVIWYLELPS